MQQINFWMQILQAIAAVALVLVTVVYVRHTKQLVEQNSNCYLGIEDFDLPNVRGCQISIMNYGPGNAVKYLNNFYKLQKDFVENYRI